MKAEDNSTKLSPIQPTTMILNCILSLVHAEDEQKAKTTNVIGFVSITSVDKDRQIVTVLSPSPRSLPKNVIFLLSDQQFVDLE